MLKLKRRCQTGRAVASACVAISLLTLGGCAQLPNLGQAPTIKPVEKLQSEYSLATPFVADWPDEHWWESYDDYQLSILIAEALRDSPNMQLANARMHMAEAMVTGANAAISPEVSANASVTEAKQSYNYLIPKAALPQGWTDYGQATMNLSWELDFWGKNHAALAAAISEQGAAQAEVAQTRLVLSTSVASVYAELLHLYAVRDAVEASLELRNKTVELFYQRNQNGLETLASVRQMEARRAATQAELFGVDERIALTKNALASLVGAGPDRGLSIQRPVARTINTISLPANLSLNLLGRRPDIVAARLRTEAAAKRIDQQKAGFYPSVNLMAFAGFQALDIDKMSKAGSNFGGVGPAISLPIFNTQRLQGQLRGARAEYDASVATYNATLSNALREVADATTSRRHLDGELAALRAAVTAADDAYRMVDQRYKGSLATYLDVLSAEDALISTRRALADLETRAVELDVSMVRALGGGYQSTDKQARTAPAING